MIRTLTISDKKIRGNAATKFLLLRHPCQTTKPVSPLQTVEVMKFSNLLLVRNGLMPVAIFLILNLSVNAQPYNFYYGNIHAHSGYSDGNIDSVSTMHHSPAQDYDYAKSSLHFDFLGISDHNHSGAGMSLPHYHVGVTQSNTANNNGVFVALYGMEYGVISNGGHVLVYGIDSLIGWQSGNYDIFCGQFNYTQLYSLINARPNAFASLAHPQTGDYSNLDGTAYNSTADNAISGMSVRSGFAMSTTTNYTDNPATLYESYFKTLLSKGYHLGPSIDHDNHYTTFGRTLPGRTVVLAGSLTKANVLSALKASRYYASDDWNIQVNFTINGFFMGSSNETTSNSTITATITDPDNENISKIEVFYGVPGSNNLPTVLTTVTNTATLNYTHNTNVGNTFYYYLKITQADGDLVWTAPVWITRIFGAAPLELTDYQVNAVENQVNISWEAVVDGKGVFVVERSVDGLHFESLTEIAAAGERVTLPFAYTDNDPYSGTSFYRIRWQEHDGATVLSPIRSVYLFRLPIKLTALSPNPAHDKITAGIDAQSDDPDLIWLLYNADGREVTRGAFGVAKGTNLLEININDMPGGRYFLVLGKPGARMVETGFIKAAE